MTILRIYEGAIVERLNKSLDDIPAHKRQHWRLLVDDGPPAGYVRELHTIARAEEIELDAVRAVYSLTQRPHAQQVEAVKAEQSRRIVARYPEWQQLNILRRADPAEIAAMDSYITACGASASALEAMDPVPADYRADARWPA